MKRFDEANKIFEQAIQQNDQMLEPLVNKANVMIALDHLNEA